MTLNDIGRLLRMAKVPRSKTVQHGGGSGFQQCFILHVPVSHYMICANVVGRLEMLTANVQVVMLDPDCRDVPEGKHVFYKMNASRQDQWYYPQYVTTEREQRWYRSKCWRARHANVVIDCATVALG